MSKKRSGRRVEMNPGEFFMVAPRTILVESWESVIGDVFKIGSPEHRTAYLFTFSGRVNNEDEHAGVTVAMDPEAAWELVGQVLDGLELLARSRELEQ